MTKDEEIKKLKRRLAEGNTIIHNMVVSNQAAYIAYKSGDVASSFEWISNGLFGPGNIPRNDENKTPQQWYDANSIDMP